MIADETVELSDWIVVDDGVEEGVVSDDVAMDSGEKESDVGFDEDADEEECND